MIPTKFMTKFSRLNDLYGKASVDINLRNQFSSKVEQILKGSLDSIQSPSPSMKIQIMGGKVFLRCKGILLGIVSKLLKTKSLLTSPSNVLPYYFPANNLNFH